MRHESARKPSQANTHTGPVSGAIQAFEPTALGPAVERNLLGGSFSSGLCLESLPSAETPLIRSGSRRGLGCQTNLLWQINASRRSSTHVTPVIPSFAGRDISPASPTPRFSKDRIVSGGYKSGNLIAPSGSLLFNLWSGWHTIRNNRFIVEPSPLVSEVPSSSKRQAHRRQEVSEARPF
jgi:hypothetical protein